MLCPTSSLFSAVMLLRGIHDSSLRILSKDAMTRVVQIPHFCFLIQFLYFFRVHRGFSANDRYATHARWRIRLDIALSCFEK